MNRQSAALILTDIQLKNSIKKIRNFDFIYASKQILNKIIEIDLYPKLKIQEIYFEALESCERINYNDLFIALSTLGEMRTSLIASDKQIDILNAANMIKLPHIEHISIVLDKAKLNNSIHNIAKAKIIANKARAHANIRNEKDDVLGGSVDINLHQTIVLELQKDNA